MQPRPLCPQRVCEWVCVCVKRRIPTAIKTSRTGRPLAKGALSNHAPASTPLHRHPRRTAAAVLASPAAVRGKR